MKPAPKIAITRFGAGVHSFWNAEKDLSVGIVPSVIKSWSKAVLNGYFITRRVFHRRSGPERPSSLNSVFNFTRAVA
jgi:hypothetical protein